MDPAVGTALEAGHDLDLLPLGIVHTDAGGTIMRANRMFGELLGVSPTALLGRNLLEFAVGELDRYAEMIDFGAGFTRTTMGPLAVAYRGAGGMTRHGALWSRNHLDRPDVGVVVCALVPEATVRGVTAALGSIAEGEPVDTTLGLLADSIRGHPFEARGCWLVEDDGDRRLVADGELDAGVSAALARPGRWWDAIASPELVHCHDTTDGDDTDRSLADAGVAAWWALPCRGLHGRRAAALVLRADAGPISPNQLEHLDQIVTTAGLAFERESTRAMLDHLAFHDPLTGLANRGRFFDREQPELAPGAALLYVDLDRFKPVNDELGHSAGDLVLVTVADRIRRAIRPGDRIARFGGDEFVVECEGVSTDEEAVAIADRILAAVAEPIELDAARVSVGASIGIARSDEPIDVDALLDRSDAALLRAKASGRGRWHLAPTSPSGVISRV